MNSSADQEDDLEYERVLSANFSNPQQSQYIEPFSQHSCYQASTVQLTKPDDKEHSQENSCTALNSYDILGSDKLELKLKCQHP